MSKLVWGQQTSQRYSSGIDRGVLYPENGPGVVWNGLISIEEALSGGEQSAHHFDGVKYLDLVSPKNFKATITAFSAPDAFSECLGERSIIPGFILTRQPRSRFQLSYRTSIDGGEGYKIHLIYNALASPNNRTYSTIGDNQEPSIFSWNLEAVPPSSATYRPSAHLVIESTKTDPAALEVLEEILYGTTTTVPRFPTIDELIDTTYIWDLLAIVPQTVTGLAQLTLGMSDLYTTQMPGILRAPPNTRLLKTAVVGLYRME